MAAAPRNGDAVENDVLREKDDVATAVTITASCFTVRDVRRGAVLVMWSNASAWSVISPDAAAAGGIAKHNSATMEKGMVDRMVHMLRK